MSVSIVCMINQTALSQHIEHEPSTGLDMYNYTNEDSKCYNQPQSGNSIVKVSVL